MMTKKDTEAPLDTQTSTHITNLADDIVLKCLRALTPHDALSLVSTCSLFRNHTPYKRTIQRAYQQTPWLHENPLAPTLLDTHTAKIYYVSFIPNAQSETSQSTQRKKTYNDTTYTIQLPATWVHHDQVACSNAHTFACLENKLLIYPHPSTSPSRMLPPMRCLSPLVQHYVLPKTMPTIDKIVNSKRIVYFLSKYNVFSASIDALVHAYKEPNPLSHCFSINDQTPASPAFRTEHTSPHRLDNLWASPYAETAFVQNKQHNLFAKGFSHRGSLGVKRSNDTYVDAFTPISGLDNAWVQDIACCSSHTLALTQQGSIYLAGLKKTQKQANHPCPFLDINHTFEPISHVFSSKATQITCGETLSCVLDAQGNFYVSCLHSQCKNPTIYSDFFEKINQRTVYSRVACTDHMIYGESIQGDIHLFSPHPGKDSTEPLLYAMQTLHVPKRLSLRWFQDTNTKKMHKCSHSSP